MEQCSFSWAGYIAEPECQAGGRPPIKSIFAVYSGDAQGSSELKLALLMARKYGASHRGGLARPSPLESRYSSYMTDEVRNIVRSRDAETVSNIRADFDARMAAGDLPVAADFLELAGARNFALATARAATTSSWWAAARPRSGTSTSLSGRTLIFVPHEYATSTLNEHALVAWDGKRAAARALGDAMHILETKSRVTVPSVGGERRLPRSPGPALRHGPTARQPTDRTSDHVSQTSFPEPIQDAFPHLGAPDPAFRARRGLREGAVRLSRVTAAT